SLPLAITVMVPNSLGPAELLIHYGTQTQRDHYLPRLARGEEIPCFALTEPGAGSDAGAISSRGTVIRGEDGGLYVRLNWKKRYITLGAVSTLIGLAFRLHDPDRLLGDREDLGITCALIPSNTPGVKLGRRHDPLGVSFINSPTEGHDVVVPVDAIIGGLEGAGRGWRMLMECLAAGRGISLPALSTGGAKLVTRVITGHGAVRKQFGLAIGRFEGIQAPIARTAALTYLMDAARIYTCGGLATGAKPSVVTAILKYNTTELQRLVVNDGMDVLGGNGIARGPRNLLAGAYAGAPIGITVEGANILTRTLIIFGQGAIRCHPYALREIKAIAANDAVEFDRAFWGHVGHIIRNKCRALVLSLSRGYLARVPGHGRSTVYYRRLAWVSASFAFWADVAMGTLGGTLKRKEQISGRFADILSWMYLITATLRRFDAEGGRREAEPLLRWSVEYGFARIQEAFEGLFQNLPVPVIGPLIRGPIAAWSRLNRVGRYPSDRLTAMVAEDVQVPDGVRQPLTSGIYLPADRTQTLGRMEHAMRLVHESEAVLRKIRDAIRGGELPVGKPEARRREALEAGIITAEQDRLIEEAESAREDYIQVDSFAVEEFVRQVAESEMAEADSDGAHLAGT
ncbi:MAG TPA: acyl-CoA dehydrogenase, partial [Rhodothermales bacterium]